MLKRAAGKITMVILTVSVISACIIRFFQLLRFTDSKTGLVNSNEKLTYILYAFILLVFICSAVYYAKGKKNLPEVFETGKNNRLFLSSVLLCVTFFFDFIHQCYNCFLHIQSNVYVEYAYVILLGLSGFFALLSSFYFLTFAVTVRGSNYDFKNFTLLHFTPVLWAFAGLFVIMIKIVDIKAGAQTVCEFIFLAAVLVFFICLISAVDRSSESAARTIVFFCCIVFSMSLITALPRLAVFLSGSKELLYSATFSSVTYIALGIFSLTVLSDINKRIKG